MGKVIIDQKTGEIVDLAESIRALPRLSDVKMDMAVRKAAVERKLDPRSAPQPGGPWVVGGWEDIPVEVRIANMTAAKTGGAFAEAMEMQERGYAVGHIPG